MPFVVKADMLGTSLGMVSIFQNAGLMLLALLFSYIHDKTLETESGYFWSLICFLILSMFSMILKVQIGIWDAKRGNILNSKHPYEEFMEYIEEKQHI